MDDLISRQAVLNLLDCDKPQLLDSDALYMAIEALEKQIPKQDVPDTNVGDIITRQAAVDERSGA